MSVLTLQVIGIIILWTCIGIGLISIPFSIEDFIQMCRDGILENDEYEDDEF